MQTGSWRCHLWTIAGSGWIMGSCDGALTTWREHSFLFTVWLLKAHLYNNIATKKLLNKPHNILSMPIGGSITYTATNWHGYNIMSYYLIRIKMTIKSKIWKTCDKCLCRDSNKWFDLTKQGIFWDRVWVWFLFSLRKLIIIRAFNINTLIRVIHLKYWM